MKVFRPLSLFAACVAVCLLAGCSTKSKVTPSSPSSSSTSTSQSTTENQPTDETQTTVEVPINNAQNPATPSDSIYIPDRPTLPAEDLEEDNSIVPADFQTELNDVLRNTVVYSEVGTAGSSFKVPDKSVTLLRWLARNDISGQNRSAFISSIRRWSAELSEEERGLFLEGWEEVLSAAYTIGENPSIWSRIQQDFGVSPVQEAPTCDLANLDTLYAALSRVAHALEAADD